jgi:CDP-6-deoxy-D-xylo-4-hexulose-3-dehydrase
MSSILELLKNLKLDKNHKSKTLREEILKLVNEYSQITHYSQSFIPNESPIPVSGKVFDFHELQNLIAASLDFWLTSDRFNVMFENELRKFLGTNFALTTNSGSSANLLAVSALTSDEHGERSLKPGDEIITVAACFPTTVNPILQNGLIPVFLDVSIPTYNIDVTNLEKALSPKTKGIMLAHTLGNPFDVNTIVKFASKHNLWLIEDCCDALGSLYEGKKVGIFGDVATLSFYPAHQITTGEGGAIFTNSPKLRRLIESFRDWGRDCFCAPGVNNTCGKRFEWKLGQLPLGYDHKYVYSNLGYNLKMTEMQASIGLAQMEKISDFIKARKNNFQYLKDNLNSMSDYFIMPEATESSDPSWFGFPITIKKNSSVSRNELTQFLSKKKIDSRPIFAGNITKQPYFLNKDFRICGNLANTDLIMNNSFWIGLFPGLNEKMLDYVVTSFKEFFGNHT